MPDPDSPSAAASLSIGQARVLEKIARGAPLEEVLADLARAMQAQHPPGARCAVMLLDDSGQNLRIGAAPDMPQGYLEMVRVFPVDPQAALCGRAAYQRALAVSTDIATDENWERWRQIALRFGLRSGWSAPIFSQAGQVLGCFATYHAEPREPLPKDLEEVKIAAHLASLAIEQARAAEKQQRTEEKFRAVFDQALDAILIVDEARRCVEANAAALELFAVPRETLVGQSVDEFLISARTGEATDCAAIMDKLLRGGQLEGECAIRQRGGARRQVMCRARANFLPGLHLCQMHDITGRKQAEDELRYTEQFYRTLVDTTNTGYIVNDAAGFVIDANAEYVRLTGRANMDEVRGHHVLEWTAPHDQERNHAAVARCAAGEAIRNFELDYIHPNGQVTPVEINATFVQTADGPRLLALCRDISDRRRTQRELQEAQEALETRVRERTTELAHANAEIRARAHRQEAVAAFGWRALTHVEISALMQEGAELVCKTLGVEIASVLEKQEPDPGGGTAKDDMMLRAACGLPNDWLGQGIANSREDSLSGYVLRIRQPVIVEDLVRERRFQAPSKLTKANAVSGVTVVIAGGGGQPFGVMHAYSRRRRAFTPEDVHFLQSIANVLAEAIERRRAEEAGRRARQEAENANAAKSEFLSRMSHELRTPLNAILGFSQLLEIENLAPTQHESVSQIVRAGRHLLELVNEVLDIARIESGHLAMAPEPVPAGMLLREALELIRPLAKARQIELVLSAELEDSPHHLLADRQRFRQAVLNLLSNAVKYNREGGRVTVGGGLTLGGERLRVEITDTGEGIAPEKLARLFTPFDRLGAEESGVEGSGIGLALSKRLIEAQRGTLGVESVLGKGCTFWVEMPLAAALGPAPLPAELLESLLSPMEKNEMSGRATARQVLHIEDNESNRLLVELLLGQRPNVELRSASTGQEGLKLAHERLPDLVLLDMHLPDTPGEEVLSTLRAEDRTRHIPVVIISADAGGARVRQLRAAGANDYLTKPFNVGQFLRVLDQHLLAEKTKR